ncbi:MAG: hypothetical protein AB7I50_10960, partial [Vicinamibacterales bacterium]
RANKGIVSAADLPPEVRQLAVAPMEASLDPAEALAERVARLLFGRMMERRESFWTAVHDPFMARDLTRDTLRRVIRLALEQVNGRHGDLVAHLNVPRTDAKRLLAFLRKHDCLSTPDAGATRRKNAADPTARAS